MTILLGLLKSCPPLPAQCWKLWSPASIYMLPKFCLAKNLPKVTVPVPSREILVCGGTCTFRIVVKQNMTIVCISQPFSNKKGLQRGVVIGVYLGSRVITLHHWKLWWKTRQHQISSENSQVVWVNIGIPYNIVNIVPMGYSHIWANLGCGACCSRSGDIEAVAVSAITEGRTAAMGTNNACA